MAIILISETMDNRSKFYHPELDCLRFVAFLSVFIYHLEEQFHTVMKLNSPGEWMLMCIFKSGVFGVDLFFCLSSFLITILLLREHDLRGGIDVRAFWMRRILRIWPLYYLFLILSATIIPYWLQRGQLFGWHLFNYWFFLGNWDSVAHGFLKSPAGPLWSVSIEEQFYLVWPLLLLIVKPKRIVPLAVAALVGANVFRLLHHPPVFNQQWANTLYHVDSIAGGVIGAALNHANRLNLSTLMRFVLLLIGVFMIPAYFFCHGFQAFFDGKDLALYPVSSLCCLLTVVSLYNLKALPWNSVFMKAWAYLGRISYGLYVFHMLAITWVVLQFYDRGYYDGGIMEMFSKVKPAMFASALGLTILLAWASYTFWETPFLKLKKKFTYILSSPQTQA
jgi:peptidoglycan/LPS O-acetylase OafA/YrhL